jgi:hypothetical protein
MSSSSFFFNRNNKVSMAVCISLPIITGAAAAFYYYHHHYSTEKQRSVGTQQRSTSNDRSRSASSPIDKSSSLDELIGNSHRLISVGIEEPLVIAMVGLPARGKSYIVKMTIRYCPDGNLYPVKESDLNTKKYIVLDWSQRHDN